MIQESDIVKTDEDWFYIGKNDAWCGRPKQAQGLSSGAASQYDLGYSEGLTRRPPNIVAPCIRTTTTQRNRT